MPKMTIGGRRAAKISLQFLIDVAKARRKFLAGRYGERKAFRLPDAVVGILTKDDDPDPLARRQFEGAQHPRRIDDRAGRLPRAKMGKQRTARR